MPNQQFLLKQLHKGSVFSSTKLSSRNTSNILLNKTTKKIKSKATSRKASCPKQLSSIQTFSSIIRKNLQKRNSTPTEYSKYVIVSIVFDGKKHCVSTFKNYLLWDETSEFLKRYYQVSEAKYRLPKITAYYEKFTLMSPVYFGFAYALTKTMVRFTKKKRKYLEFIEATEEQFKKSNDICFKAKEKQAIAMKQCLFIENDSVSSIERKPKESIVLSRIDNNMSLSFRELIEKTSLCITSTEPTAKPKNALLQKLPQKKKIAVDSLAEQGPTINAKGLNRFITETANLRQTKRNYKQINCIPFISHSNKQTTNNSITKPTANSATKQSCYTSRKIQDRQSIQSKMNVNVNFNINLNINIQSKPNQPHKTNKLVLTTHKHNLKRKMAIGDDNGLLKPRLANKSEGNQQKNSVNTMSILSKTNHKNTPPMIIPNLKATRTTKAIPRTIEYRNHPLTTRVNDKEILSVDFLTKLINSQQKAIRHLKSQNTSKERKTLI